MIWERGRQVEAPAPAPAYLAHAFPVSVKGVAIQDGKVLLLENERDEWELPGGKLELGEDPPDCVVRELGEETGWQVTAGPLLDCWQYQIRPGSDVVIVTYGCYVRSTGPPVISNEHKTAGLFTPGQVPELVMPDGYKRSVAAWFARLDNGQPPVRGMSGMLTGPPGQFGVDGADVRQDRRAGW